MPVVFGIKPKFAHTGYGYLEMGPVLRRKSKFAIHKLKAFHEKPSQPVADKYFKSKYYYWNSGMFVWRSDALLQATSKYLPKVFALTNKIKKSGGMKKLFPSMPNISIDYGLMEKLSGKILAIPVDIDWNDLGGWHSFADLWPKDKNQNVARGNCLLVDSSRNIVKSHKKLIALLGVEDHVIIDTEDALLVCPRSKTESIRKIIEALKIKKYQQHL